MTNPVTGCPSGKSNSNTRFFGGANLDDMVNGDDFTLLVGNLGKQANGADVVLPASDYAAVDAFAAANGLMAEVPEPTSFGLFGLLAAGVLTRRRRTP